MCCLSMGGVFFGFASFVGFVNLLMLLYPEQGMQEQRIEIQQCQNCEVQERVMKNDFEVEMYLKRKGEEKMTQL